MEEELRRQDHAEPWRLVDLRGPAAHRRRHPLGAIPIPASRLPSSLFLLPPKTRPVLLVARAGDEARKWAAWLGERGWLRTGWLDGNPNELRSSLSRSGVEPNRSWEAAPLLRRHESILPSRGLCCDLACGSGRNATYLALRGLGVIAVDVLPDALLQARTVARAAGLLGSIRPPRARSTRARREDERGEGKRNRSDRRAAAIQSPGRLRFLRGDLTDPGVVRGVLRPGRFDVLLCFRYLDRALLPSLAEAIKGGGILFFETFLEEQARAKGRPRRPEHLLRPGELGRAFAEFEILEYHEGEDEEGNWIASLAARKPVG